jgi:hypothetical protein
LFIPPAGGSNIPRSWSVSFRHSRIRRGKFAENRGTRRGKFIQIAKAFGVRLVFHVESIVGSSLTSLSYPVE